MKKLCSPGKLLAFLVILSLCAGREASAQTVVDYNTLNTALNNGATTITNFGVNSSGTPITILYPGAGSAIQISNAITIDAAPPGMTNYVIFQGGNVSRLFSVHPGASLTLKNVELTGGFSTNGGAIYNQGTLVISNCLLMGNTASNSNGASYGTNLAGGNGTNAGNGLSAAGGAIYSTGPVSILFSILSNNVVFGGNGGNGGTGSGNVDSQINGGNGGNGGAAYGGAICTKGSNNIFYQSTFASNQCFGGFGGIGGSYASNNLEYLGLGGVEYTGTAGVGGVGYGGAAFAAGPLYVTNCVFYQNFAVGGATAPAEGGSDGSSATGSAGGDAFGGGIFVTNGVAEVDFLQTIFFDNFCEAGRGGDTQFTSTNSADGGNGGEALGAGLWSAAVSAQIQFCTFATNFVLGGPGGTNIFSAGSSGANGIGSGSGIHRGGGTIDLSCSILADTSTNANGVTDEGYNVISDSSVTMNFSTTKLNANPQFAYGNVIFDALLIGGPFGGPVMYYPPKTTSPAAEFIPGIPGLTFPATDEIGGYPGYRQTPTTAGANEAFLLSIVTNVAPTNLIISTLPTNILTGAGHTVSFTNTVDAQADYPNTFIGYQWQLDGTNITNGANYSGTSSNILTVKNITIFDQGSYTVIVSPSLLEWAVTNSPAVELILTNPPDVLKQPVSQLSRPIGAIVVFTLDVASPLNYDYVWTFSNSTTSATILTNGGNITGANINSLTIDGATAADEGTYSVVVSNDFGTKKSVPVRLTVVPDHARPTVTITSPNVNNVRTNSNLVVSGTATDNAQVTNVMCWITNINAGLTPVTNITTNIAALTTNGSTNLNGPNTMLWSITNPLLPGTNIMAVQSVDFSSNVSTIDTRKFFYIAPSTLTLTTNTTGGAGTILGSSFIKGDTAPASGASLNIGEGYLLTPTPNASSLLGSWTLTTSSESNVIVSNTPTLKFIMESNLSISALFVTNPFKGILGTYNGLFYALATNYPVTNVVTNETVTNTIVTNSMTNTVVTNETVTNLVTNAVVSSDIQFDSAGMVAGLSLGTLGGYSGKLLLTGNSYSLAGTFDAFGYASNYIKRTEAQGGPLIVQMNIQTNGVGILTGSVSDTNWATNSYLWGSKNSTSPGTTNYTMLMAQTTNGESSGSIPPGYSYGLIGYHGGSITLSGGLADGTTYAQSVALSESNDIPVYVSLYNKTGFLFGWLNLTNLVSTNSPDELTWIKETPVHPSALFPNGFTNTLLATGSIWNSSSSINASSYGLTISNSALDLDYTVDISDNKLSAVSGSSESLKGSVNRNNGQLQVTFGTGIGNATLKGYGAILQNLTNTGGGYFVSKKSAGTIVLSTSLGTNGNTSTNGNPGPPVP